MARSCPVIGFRSERRVTLLQIRLTLDSLPRSCQICWLTCLIDSILHLHHPSTPHHPPDLRLLVYLFSQPPRRRPIVLRRCYCRFTKEYIHHIDIRKKSCLRPQNCGFFPQKSPERTLPIPAILPTHQSLARLPKMWTCHVAQLTRLSISDGTHSNPRQPYL